MTWMYTHQKTMFSREVSYVTTLPLDLLPEFVSIKGDGKDGRYPRQGSGHTLVQTSDALDG